jgi:LuxR family quorum-sensing system transcriptional regulator CciR
MIPLTRWDLAVLEAAAKQGLGNGFTVPAHVPGEVNGSCSFATAKARPLQAEHLAVAQLVGAFAFEAARRLARSEHRKRADPARFSDRERDCLIWVARGKSDSEIATILGISPETVHQYVKQARASYDAVSRSQLVAHALFSGTISFMDIFKR